MSDKPLPFYTHFSSGQSELPRTYYEEIGRALYRWSQMEWTVCALATSILGVPWFEALKRLRGGTGFKVKNVFEQLQAGVTKRGGSAEVSDALEGARRLYETRKILFHSSWGHVTGEGVVGIGIQEWSNTSYDNFREVSLSELSQFSRDCLRIKEQIMKTAVPFFHGASAFILNDDDGIPQGVDVEAHKRAGE